MRTVYIYVLVLINSITLFLANAQDKSPRQLLKEATMDIQAKKYSDGLNKAKQVYDYAISKEDTLLKGESSLLIGKAFSKSSSYLVALEYLFTALKIYSDNTPKRIEIYSELGDLYYTWGGFKKGLDYYKMADSICVQGDKKVHILEAIGDTYLQLNMVDNALSQYDRCTTFVREGEYEILQKLYKKKSEIYLMQHDYDGALEMEFKQLHLVQKNNSLINQATILNNIGYLYNFKSEYDKALNYFKMSKQACIKFGDTDSLYITLINIGAIYNLRKSLDSSLMALNEALTVIKSDPNKEKEATVRNYLAATLIEFKKYPEALDNNQHAINLARKVRNYALLAKCYYIRSKIQEMRGKMKEQKYFYDQYKRITDSLALISFVHKNQQIKLDSTIQDKEYKIQQLLLNKEFDYLALKHYELLSDQREKDLKLLAQQNAMQRMTLSNEILKKDQVQRMYLLTEKELENERKAREIINLQRVKSEQELKVQKANVELNKLSTENLEKKLALQNQQAEINKSRLTRLWLITGFSAVLLLAFMFFSYWRLRQRAKENRLKLANLEIQQRLLRSQMNPHFLFNSLNSIQGFITTNDVSKADRFLACYARLMRSILDNTAKERVSLYDELNALKSYIELEQMRLDNSFSYFIDVNTLETDMIGIPPMLIQPYVENAIVHGLRHKQGNGHLSVSINAEDNYVICSISDNGIGREASRKINAKRSKEYKSVAMNLTKERLELMNSQENTIMHVSIDDLIASNGEPLGTNVVLKIALTEWI